MGTATKAMKAAETVEQAVMLVIGSADNWAKGPDEGASDYHFVDYRALGAEVLETLRPSVVLSALFGAGYDAMDVATRLRQMGFGGRYRAISDPLPNPDIVRAEIAQVAPGLDFDLLSLPRVTVH